MYDLYPYFTNDGSVGLFSPTDDDIYHSTYGALTESWQKFIIPSHLKEYLETHHEVKILDICYGIGYNTKTALQVFVDNFLKNEKNIKNINIKKSKNSGPLTNSIEAIYTDNISSECSSDFSVLQNEICSNILIDAVDIDKTLINLSPFIKNSVNNNYFFNKYILKKYLKADETKNKLLQIKKMAKPKLKPLQKKFRIMNEIPMIILAKLFGNNLGLSDPILMSILNSKKYTPFFSKFMLNFARFSLNRGYNYNKKSKKCAFLHNIYYRYVSKSYKIAKKVLFNTKIDLNFHVDDARRFIQSTNNTYNFIFLDAFTPAKCPVLWSLDFFNELYAKLHEDGIILTYSSSAAVRNAFLQNGFSVGKIFDKDLNKFIGTVATKNGNLIEYGLDERDLDLINSKAGICFKDKNLNLDNSEIIKNRENEILNSGLVSSTSVLKGHKNDKAESL